MSVTVGGDLLRRGDEQRREETGTLFFCFLNLFPSSLSRVLCHRFRARRVQEKRQVDAAVNLGPSSFPLKWGKCRYIYDRKQRGGLRAPTRLKGQCNVFRVFFVLFCFFSFSKKEFGIPFHQLPERRVYSQRKAVAGKKNHEFKDFRKRP